MVDFEKDEVQMLSDMYSQGDGHEETNFQRFSSRNRSASMSVSRNSMEPYENGDNFIGHTGSLRNERRTSFIQMSGPLYISRNHENLFRPTRGTIGRKTTEPTVDKYHSFKGMDQDGWPDNYPCKNEHLLKSGQLGVCNDPYCTACPTHYDLKGQKHNSKSSVVFDPEVIRHETRRSDNRLEFSFVNLPVVPLEEAPRPFHNILYRDANGWPGRIFSFLNPYIPGVMNPHTKVVQLWNKFFVISCLVAIFLDPLFFFLRSVEQDNKCIVINWPLTTAIVVFRSMTDFIYFIHILLQFRLAYVAPESGVVGAGDLVDHPKKIALNYLSGYFLIDFFIVLPLPQIVILLVIPRFIGLSGPNYAKNLLHVAVLVQYIPRLYRFLLLMVGQSLSGFTCQSARAKCVMNLLAFVLSGHVVGSCWYLFGLQRVNQCLLDACHASGMKSCMKFIDCGYGNYIGSFKSDATRTDWMNNEKATFCFDGGFPYGIYVQAVNITTEHSIIGRYIYSFFWGFQQISTLAGNQTPTIFVWEVLFTMAIIGLGLLPWALLIGNMQNFLQALGRRQLEMSLRHRDVEQWMSNRRFPEELRRQVRQSERYNWAATRGVNEEMLLENLPEDLQRDIRRHLFKFVKNVRIFALMDEPILDAICERLRQRTYIEGSKILYRGGPIEKMAFIVRGKMESIGEDGIAVALTEGDVCGEELLAWCLEHSSLNKGRRKGSIPGQRLLSNRMVRCFTNVQAFTLWAADIEEVANLFSRFLRNPRVQGAIRYESPYWRGLAARRIQLAWRYRKKRLNRADTANSESPTQSFI